jgi:isochorismate hydrolase
MAVTKEFAVKIDTELSSWYHKRWDLRSKLDIAEDTKKFYEKHYPTRVEEIQKAIDEIAVLESKISAVNVEIAKLNKIYNQDPWTRAFLVIASNGHVHSSMDCNTCFPTTRYNWLVQYSNDDESTIVEDAGQDACTICYPSAPAEVLNRPSRIVTADKIAKAEAKAERDAKKAARIAKEKANAPTASGKFLTYKEGKWTREIKTERSAIIEWCDLQKKILENKYQKRRAS